MGQTLRLYILTADWSTDHSMRLLHFITVFSSLQVLEPSSRNPRAAEYQTVAALTNLLPQRYAEHDIYTSHERDLPNRSGILPESDLLEAIHAYSSKFYGAKERERRRREGGETNGGAGTSGGACRGLRAGALTRRP